MPGLESDYLSSGSPGWSVTLQPRFIAYMSLTKYTLLGLPYSTHENQQWTCRFTFLTFSKLEFKCLFMFDISVSSYANRLYQCENLLGPRSNSTDCAEMGTITSTACITLAK